jgi:hypothetical protein
MLVRNARTEVRLGARVVLVVVVVWKGKTGRKIVDDKLAGGDQGIAYPTIHQPPDGPCAYYPSGTF